MTALRRERERERERERGMLSLRETLVRRASNELDGGSAAEKFPPASCRRAT